ncbi:MAG: hypothetical protein ABSC02_06685 [Acidobacteriota bacterium]
MNTLSFCGSLCGKPTGSVYNCINGLSHIMGFLLVCIGIQFVINGVRDLVLDTKFWQG